MCKKGNIILGTLRVLIIIICEIHMLLGGVFIAGWVFIQVEADGDHISNLSLVFSILAILIGIFGIVAASKRNLWLVGIFAVCRLIWMSLYSALAAHIAKILNELPDVLIEAQLQDDEGLNTTSTTYKPYEDDDFSAYPIYYIIAVTMALVEVLTILASLSYGYIVRRQKTSSRGAYRF